MKQHSRREFIQISLAGTFAAITLTSCEYDTIVNPGLSGNSIKIDLTNQLSDGLYGKAPGKPRLILDNLGAGFSKSFDGINFGIPLIISRIKSDDDEDDFSCFSSLCTHMSCTGIRPSLGATLTNRHIVCPCHSSRFDAFNHGKVVQGPAEASLKEFKTKYYAQSKTLEIFY
jgi:Rieske Fe-S protein